MGAEFMINDDENDELFIHLIFEKFIINKALLDQPLATASQNA